MLLKSIKNVSSHDYLNMPPVSRRLRRQHLRNTHNRSLGGHLRYSIQLHLARCFLYRHTASKKNWDLAIPDVLPSDSEFLFPFAIDDSVRYERRHRATAAYPYISFDSTLEPIRSQKIHFPNPGFYRLLYRHLLTSGDIEDYVDAYQVADFCYTGFDPDVDTITEFDD